MKIGLILPSNIWFAPYLKNYTNIFDEEGIEYEIVSWNRDGRDEIVGKQFKERPTASKLKFIKVLSWIKFCKYAKRVVRESKYDKLIVFSPQLSIFLNGFLTKYYNGKYIFDYRDLSIEQMSIFAHAFKKVLDHSYANVISSPGFRRCLPEKEYLVSHNFDIKMAKKVIGTKNIQGFGNVDVINVLTIGGIRDFESNVQILHALANKDGYKILFVGSGYASEQLQKVSHENGYKNVEFVGYYKKEDELSYVERSTFLNIFYPRRISHDTALSNRFYNSLIFRKPMIVTNETIQGDYAQKYNVGVVLKNCDNIDSELKNFIRQDFNAYAERCDILLRSFFVDQEQFVNKVKKFAGGGE